MSQANQGEDGIHIHISGVQAKPAGKGEAAGPPKRGDYSQFERTGVFPIQVERYSEHGKTPIQSLGFDGDDQRLAALRLLNLPDLYALLPAICDHILQMGNAADAEHRYFAAAAAAQLVRVQPFADIKRRIIAPWAQAESHRCRFSASVALAECLEIKQARADALALAHHWCTCDNILLADVAMAGFYWSSGRYPDEALGAIQDVVCSLAPWQFLLDGIRRLFGSVYDAEPQRSIEYLSRWIETSSDDTLRWLAVVLVLDFLRIEDVAADDEARTRSIDLLFRMWEGLGLEFDALIQEETTFKIKDWAERTIALWHKEKAEVMSGYRALFIELERRYQGRSRNRLKRELERWQRQRDREKERQRRRSAEANPERTVEPSFLDLLKPA
jgi:hypothetical protein